MFHLFQTYVTFKCFMLHVFYVVRRVRGRRGVMVARHRLWAMWCCELVGGGRVARRAGASGRGHDEAGCGCGVGRTDGAGCADGGGSNLGGQGRLRASRTDVTTRVMRSGQGELADEGQTMQARAEMAVQRNPISSDVRAPARPFQN
jgi:hypothetical protein